MSFRKCPCFGAPNAEPQQVHFGSLGICTYRQSPTHPRDLLPHQACFFFFSGFVFERTEIQGLQSRRIHVWYICLHVSQKSTIHVYTSFMEHKSECLHPIPKRHRMQSGFYMFLPLTLATTFCVGIFVKCYNHIVFAQK